MNMLCFISYNIKISWLMYMYIQDNFVVLPVLLTDVTFVCGQKKKKMLQI